MTMPIKPTKTQRHAIYRKALVRFDERPYCLCSLIGNLASSKSLLRPFIHQEHWPEFSSCKPRLAKRYGYWWTFTPNGNRARRNALLRMIELSAPKKRKP